jgi:hypothetical protein
MVSKASALYSARVFSQEDSKFVDLVSLSKESSFLHFKYYNLAIVFIL